LHLGNLSLVVRWVQSRSCQDLCWRQ